MKIKVALIVQGIISVVFGLGFIIMPAQTMGPFSPGQELSAVFYFLTRGYGIIVLSIAGVCGCHAVVHSLRKRIRRRGYRAGRVFMSTGIVSTFFFCTTRL